MKLYVGITDINWFKTHASKEFVEEVNFWRPSAATGFRALAWGEPFLFKLHSPLNFITGGGFFTEFLPLPISLAWDVFKEANGSPSLQDFRAAIGRNRHRPISAIELCTYCISLSFRAQSAAAAL